MSTLFGIITIAALILIPGYLIYALVKSIQDERRRSGVKKVWRNFGLGLVLTILFFASWGAQAFAEWRTYVQTQEDHEKPVVFGEYVIEFGQSTLENWQSEFLQLFSFVVLASLYIHKGSAESKDSDDRMEEKIDRIVKKLGA